LVLVADSVLNLGTPASDGIVGAIEIAPGIFEKLKWDLPNAMWVGKPHVGVEMLDIARMRDISTGYIQQPAPNDGFEGGDPPVLNYNAIGFNLDPVPYAKAFSDAGLHMQECITGIVEWDSALNVDPTVYVNWYDFEVGSVFLSPSPTNHGVTLTGYRVAGQGYFKSTGWQNTPAASPALNDFYPELYGHNLKRSGQISHKWRYVSRVDAGVPTAQPSNMPARRAQIQHWFYADDIPHENGDSVDVWPDDSGLSHHLVQATVAKRPTLVRNVLNGKAVVRFDGVNDIMQATGQWGIPDTTLFLVAKQYPGGTSPQVWIDALTPGHSFLFYRGDDTDQVDFWSGQGGGDLIYHRGTPWNNFVVYIVEQTAGTITIYEGKTQKATTAVAGGPFFGLTVGARKDETLFAHMDVAAIGIYSFALPQADREAVVDLLNARFGLVG
jgi:hypothetical protein